MSIKDPGDGYRQKGVTTSIETKHPLRDTEEWENAKNNTEGKGLENAKSIIDKMWTPELSQIVGDKIKEYQTITKNHKNIVFVTVPSTTGVNKLPIALAEKLQKDLAFGQVIIGETVARSHDDFPMKSVPLVKRPFIPREYTLRDTKLASTLKGSAVVVTEDVISTGASIKAFVDCLRRENIPVITTTCLVGNPRLFPDMILKRKLEKCFKSNNIEVDSNAVADVLSRNQIELLLKHVKGDNDECRQITRDLSRVLDTRIARNMEVYPDKDVHRQANSERQNRSNERLAHGIRNQRYSDLGKANGATRPTKSQTQPTIAHNNHQNSTKPQKIFLDVPRMEEETKELNKLGAKWDNDTKSLYIMSDNPHKGAVLNQVEAMKQAKLQEELAEASTAKNKQEQGVTLESKQTSAQTNRQSTIKPK